MLKQDLDEMEYATISEVDSSHYDAPTRNEALADALGIRKTPRKGAEDSAPRPRGGATSRSRHLNKVANSSFLSPVSRQGPSDPHFVDVDTAGVTVGKTRFPSLGPFSTLHPSVAMRCLYEEENPTLQAIDVFLASNCEGNGTLVLCLLCHTEGELGLAELKLFEIDAKKVGSGIEKGSDQFENFENLFSIRPLESIPCNSAQPIQATSIPPCFKPNGRIVEQGKQDRATDILVLANCDIQQEQGLFLYRANLKIVECAFEPFKNGLLDVRAIRRIANSVNDRVDFEFIDDTKQEVNVRGCLSMVMTTNFLCERTLQAVEAGILATSNPTSNHSSIEFSLKLRADAVRLEQALSGANSDAPLTQDASFSALETTLCALFFFEILGLDVNDEGLTSQDLQNYRRSSWEQLLMSEFHTVSSVGDKDFLFGCLVPNSPGSLSPLVYVWEKLKSIRSSSIECLGSHKKSFTQSLFDSLHMLYEELKLSINSETDIALKFLGSILGRVCCVKKMIPGPRDLSMTCDLFLDHYRRHLGENWLRNLQSETKLIMNVTKTKNRRTEGSMSAFNSPPCFMSWVDGIIKGVEGSRLYIEGDPASINEACTKIHSLFRVLSILFDRDNGTTGSSSRDNSLDRARDYDVVNALIEEGYTDASVIRDEFPAGIALPLLEVLHRCRDDPSVTALSGLGALAWSLIGRDDLQRNVQSLVAADHIHTRSKPALSSFLGQSDDRNSFEDVDKDGIVPLEYTSSMLFPNDNRIREVGRLLRSSRPTYLSVPRAIEVSDHDYERMKQDKLLLLSRRVLAVPVGRGMFTIGSLRPVPAEPLPVPDLCLVGRVPPTNAMLALDVSDCPTDLKVWPEFHNGVAAGLRLPLEDDASGAVSKITRTWIVYNRPPQSSQTQGSGNGTNNPTDNVGHSHGGLLMALGLRGHLTTLEMTDIFDYLTQGSVTTTVGVLLGMASK